MKKSIILKSFLVILMCAMLIFAITPVYAATDEGFEDILTGNSSNTSNTGNTNTGNKNTGNTNTNTNSSNVQNLNALRNTSNTTNTANTLPKTGIQDSLPTVLLVVVFGISAVYAYKKIKDYRNID